MNLELLAEWIRHNLLTALTLWNKDLRWRLMSKILFYRRTELVRLPDGNVGNLSTFWMSSGHRLADSFYSIRRRSRKEEPQRERWAGFGAN